MTPAPAAATTDRPSHLHGRDVELAAVRRALATPGVRIAVARGPGGAGKSALMLAALDEAAATGALTGAGKYAQGQTARDLEPLLRAIEAALESGLDQLFDPETGLRDLQKALGDNGPILAAAGSGVLRKLAGGRDSAPVTAERADERLAQAMLQVLRWMEGFGTPVLLLVDDWGRAGPQVRRLFARIAAEPSLRLTRLLATERDEERLEPLPGGCSIVPLGPLSPEAQLALAAEQLGARSAAAGEVVAFLGSAAETPFDLIESVRILSARAMARVDGHWRLETGRAVAALAGAAARSVVRRLADLDGEALTLARVLAVCGDDAELADLARAARLDSAAAGSASESLVSSGLVRRLGGRILYAHDRLRAEVLFDTPQRTRVAMAAALSEALRESGAAPGEGARGMAMLWRRLEGGLELTDAAWWRDAFAAGAHAARQVGDREAAETFVRAGLDLSGRAGGFTYALLAEASCAAISRGDHAEACRLADAMGGLATTPAERAAADEMRVFARRVSGDLDAALDIAREVVARVGIRLPRRVTALNLLGAVLRVFSLDPRKARTSLGPEELRIEAPMIRAMNGVGSLLFERNPLLVVVLVTRSLSSRIVYGTAAGAATFALLCCSFGAYRRAARWAEAADGLQGPDQPLRAIAKQYASSFGQVFVEPRSMTRTRGEEMEALAYAGGDLAVAAYGNRDRVLDALFCADPLEETAALADHAMRVADRLSDPPTIPHVRALRQLIANLQHGGRAAWRLDGPFLRLDAVRQALEAEALANTGRAVASLEAVLGACYGAYAEVAGLTTRPWPRFAPAPFQAQSQTWAFATGLALYRTGGKPSALQRWNLRRLARLNPGDFAHRSLLLQAEALRLRGDRARALAAYEAAVAAAKVSGCLLECGLVVAASAEAAELLDDTASAQAWKSAAIEAWRALGAHGVLAARYGIAPAGRTIETTAPAAEPSRAEALRAQLGDAADELLAALRPSVDAEVADLADALARRDQPAAERHRQRLSELAENFGLQPVLDALDRPAAEPSLDELRRAVAATDWSVFEAR